MKMEDHAGHAGSVAGDGSAANALALRATVHCLAGCSIGEVMGMVLGSALLWSDGATIAVSVALAFIFGYAFTLVPLLASGLPWRTALPLALASDTLSITLMEIVDNGLMLLVPGAMDAPLNSARFWGPMAASLVLAGLAAFPLNRWLILRGKGHAVIHPYHSHGGKIQHPEHKQT